MGKSRIYVVIRNKFNEFVIVEEKKYKNDADILFTGNYKRCVKFIKENQVIIYDDE